LTTILPVAIVQSPMHVLIGVAIYITSIVSMRRVVILSFGFIAIIYPFITVTVVSLSTIKQVFWPFH